MLFSFALPERLALNAERFFRFGSKPTKVRKNVKNRMKEAFCNQVEFTGGNLSNVDLTDAILNKKTDAQIQFENHPDKGRQVRVIGNRTWVEPYIGKTGVLQGYSRSINGHEILLDSGEVLALYPEEFEFI